MKLKISQRMSLLSVILSLLTTTIFTYFIMQLLYTKMPQYEEFVTGYTSWTAYYKSGDMSLAYLVIGGILVFYGLFVLLFYFLSNKLDWLKGNVDVKLEYKSGWKNRLKKVQNIFFFILFFRFIVFLLTYREFFKDTTNYTIFFTLLLAFFGEYNFLFFYIFLYFLDRGIHK